jgi:hypothetical protein
MEDIDLRLTDRSYLDPSVQTVLYPTQTLDLRSHVVRLLVEKGVLRDGVALERLHEQVAPELLTIDEHDLNQLTSLFYDTDDKFRKTYFGLIQFLGRDALKFDFVFQSIPTVRFHPPQRFADNFRGPNGELLMYHTDTMLGHSFKEINCWLPLTKCYGTNALQLSSLEISTKILGEFCEEINFDPEAYHQNGRKRFFQKLLKEPGFRQRVVDSCLPVVTNFGEIIVFDTRCIHATAENTEKDTRVSLDFRIIPTEEYEKLHGDYRSFGKSGRRFVKGDVFYEKSAFEIAVW